MSTRENIRLIARTPLTFEQVIPTSEFTPFCVYLFARNSALLHVNNKGADQPVHPCSPIN